MWSRLAARDTPSAGIAKWPELLGFARGRRDGALIMISARREISCDAFREEFEAFLSSAINPLHSLADEGLPLDV